MSEAEMQCTWMSPYSMIIMQCSCICRLLQYVLSLLQCSLDPQDKCDACSLTGVHCRYHGKKHCCIVGTIEKRHCCIVSSMGKSTVVLQIWARSLGTCEDGCHAAQAPHSPQCTRHGPAESAARQCQAVVVLVQARQAAGFRRCWAGGSCAVTSCSNEVSCGVIAAVLACTASWWNPDCCANMLTSCIAQIWLAYPA